MLRSFDVPSARQSILCRQPIDDMTIPASVQARITSTFGEPLTPAQAVDRILADIRSRGDTALREWAAKLDGQSGIGLSRTP